MTTTAQSAAPTTLKRSLPATVYFDGDHAALKLVAQFTRYYRSSWKSLPESPAGVVVLLSDERLLADHARELRAPNVRIIAVSDERFRDPRLDSAVYAYVATSTPAPLVERTVDSAIDHMHLLATRQEANERLAGATHDIAELNGMFEGFVKAAVTAIESRDPNTSGHAFRVANLTVALAEAVNRDTTTFADVTFTREQLRELRYAALLHDFGKVAVREKVLAKSRKLYPEQMQVIRQRFELARRTVELENGRERLEYVVKNGREAYEKKQAEFDRKLGGQVAELEQMLAAVEAADAPAMMPNGSSQATYAGEDAQATHAGGDAHATPLRQAAEREFAGRDGERLRLLTDDELGMLSIGQGSLNDAERLEIESHVIHTYNFLSQIPWTRELSGVAQIARGHHEKLNGSGYPAHLKASDIPLTTRMMTVADVFDALAAGDRPYKQPLGVERALELLGRMVRDGELDPDVYRVFLENRVWERWV
ncbi:MAG TPA: HD domain-containing phosphohydrolase [Clostridia bacterium]|nr:HD domain-containing phosphohydrolase [Clostridia bacterium]